MLPRTNRHIALASFNPYLLWILCVAVTCASVRVTAILPILRGQRERHANGAIVTIRHITVRISALLATLTILAVVAVRVNCGTEQY